MLLFVANTSWSLPLFLNWRHLSLCAGTELGILRKVYGWVYCFWDGFVIDERLRTILEPHVKLPEARESPYLNFSHLKRGKTKSDPTRTLSHPWLASTRNCKINMNLWLHRTPRKSIRIVNCLDINNEPIFSFWKGSTTVSRLSNSMDVFYLPMYWEHTAHLQHPCALHKI